LRPFTVPAEKGDNTKLTPFSRLSLRPCLPKVLVKSAISKLPTVQHTPRDAFTLDGRFHKDDARFYDLPLTTPNRP
jgi:hypothetical protein